MYHCNSVPIYGPDSTNTTAQSCTAIRIYGNDILEQSNFSLSFDQNCWALFGFFGLFLMLGLVTLCIMVYAAL